MGLLPMALVPPLKGLILLLLAVLETADAAAPLLKTLIKWRSKVYKNFNSLPSQWATKMWSYSWVNGPCHGQLGGCSCSPCSWLIVIAIGHVIKPEKRVKGRASFAGEVWLLLIFILRCKACLLRLASGFFKSECCGFSCFAFVFFSLKNYPAIQYTTVKFDFVWSHLTSFYETTELQAWIFAY